MKLEYNTNYPAIEDLIRKSKKKIPKIQVQQVMEQICCAKVSDFPRHLI